MKLTTNNFKIFLLITLSTCISMQAAFARQNIQLAQALPTAPTFDMQNAVYRSYPYLDISAQSGTKIYYTTDGSQPTTSSTLVVGRIYPTTTTQYNAIAVDGSGNQSAVSSLWMCLDAAAWSLPTSNTRPGANQLLWLRSDFGIVSNPNNVSRWVDLSGNANDATQTFTANQPTEVGSQLNGFSTVNFLPGTNSQFLQIPSGFSDFSNGATLFVVTKPTNFSSGAKLLDIGNGAASDNISLSESSATGGIQASIYNGSTASSVNASAALSPGQFQLITMLFDGAQTATLFKNGAQIAQSTTMQTPNVIVRAQNYLGQSSAGDNFFQGQISEAIVYSTGITLQQRFAVESYLMSKYQILSQTQVAPIFSSASTTFTTPSQVVLSSDGNSQIFWTNDNSTPTSSSNLYTKPLNIYYSQTINAVAISTLTGNVSPVSSATYSLDSTQWPAPSPGGPALQINITAPSTSIPQ